MKLLRCLALWVVICLATVAFPATGQHLPVMSQHDSTCLYAMRGWVHVGSPFLSRSDYQMLRGGGTIGEEGINELAAALKDFNIAGAFYDFSYEGLHGRRRKGASGMYYRTLRAGYLSIQEGGFPREAGLLTLYGNAPYQGDTLTLGPLRFRNLQYIHFKPGVMKTQRRGEGNLYMALYAGVNLGLGNLSADVWDAQLYTAPYGEMISLGSKMRLSRSLSNDDHKGGIRGAGVGADLLIAWVGDRGTALALGITDIGFISWSDGYSYKRDTTLIWEGVIIDNIFKPGDSWGDGIQPDTLDKLFTSYGNRGRHATATPTALRVDIALPVTDFPLVLRGTLLHRPQTIMKPLMELSIDYHPSKRLILSRTHTFGGYGNYSTGFAITGRAGKNLWLYLRATDIYRIAAKDSHLNIQMQGGIMYRTQKKLPAP
jgi:hypothetical protein